jgi:hypothetical protein
MTSGRAAPRSRTIADIDVADDILRSLSRNRASAEEFAIISTRSTTSPPRPPRDFVGILHWRRRADQRVVRAAAGLAHEDYADSVRTPYGDAASLLRHATGRLSRVSLFAR